MRHRHELADLVGARVSVTFVSATGAEDMVSGVVASVSPGWVVLTDANTVDNAPVDGRVRVAIPRIVTLQEPGWR